MEILHLHTVCGTWAIRHVEETRAETCFVPVLESMSGVCVTWSIMYGKEASLAGWLTQYVLVGSWSTKPLKSLVFNIKHWMHPYALCFTLYYLAHYLNVFLNFSRKWGTVIQVTFPNSYFYTTGSGDNSICTLDKKSTKWSKLAQLIFWLFLFFYFFVVIHLIKREIVSVVVEVDSMNDSANFC